MFFLFFPLLLFALNVNVDFGTKNSKSYEVLTLYNNKPFTCIIKDKNLVQCVFDKVPTTPVFKDHTYYFKIRPVFGKNKFYINIKIKGNYNIYTFKDNLYNKPLITPFKITKAKKWVIVANNMFVKQQVDGLKFYYKETLRPYVGAIDDKLNPVRFTRNSDILKYFAILKAYKKGADVTDEINSFVKNYPKSVFIPDVLYLKLKILDKNGNSQQVIDLGKKWIKNYAYSEYLPEVLLLIGKNYAKQGFMSEASYYFNRIMTDYPNSKWAYLAMINLADQMYAMGDEKKAFALYEKALYSTTNLDIASLAAARLAQRYMDKGDIKKAIEYYKKIYNANKKFLLKNRQKAYELANMLANHKIYSLAVNIGKDLLKNMKKLNPIYEPLLYKLALWSYENKNYKQALNYIKLYLKKFPYGDFSDSAKMLRDKILFNLPENNLTKKLENINVILKNYSGEIAQKALVEKARILFKMKKYEELIKMLPKLQKIDNTLFPDKKEFMNKVLKEYLIYLLKNSKCIKADSLIQKYHIKLDKKYDADIYRCAMAADDYRLASKICDKYLDSPNDKIFILWIKRKIDALKALGDDKDVVKAVDDLCGVAKKECYPYLLDKFFALWNLKEYKQALNTALKLEKYKNIQNCDVFIKIVNRAVKNGDTLLAASFAKKIIDLQNSYKTYPYSPFVDFIYAKYTKNKKEAVKVMQNLIPRVKGENLARAYFMLANLTGEKSYLDKCVKVKDSKMWKKLCKGAMGLF